MQHVQLSSHVRIDKARHASSSRCYACLPAQLCIAKKVAIALVSILPVTVTPWVLDTGKGINGCCCQVLDEVTIVLQML